MAENTSETSQHETQARILETFAASRKHPMINDQPLIDALTAGAQALRGSAASRDQEIHDHGAALLPADPSASPATTEALPNCEDCGKPYPFGIDLVLSDPDWLRIHPSGDGGLLCAGCMAQRAAALPDSVVVFARIVTGAQHDAFRAIKNASIEALSVAAQFTGDELTAMLKGLDDIRHGHMVALDQVGSGNQSASAERSAASPEPSVRVEEP